MTFGRTLEQAVLASIDVHHQREPSEDRAAHPSTQSKVLDPAFLRVQPHRTTLLNRTLAV